MHYISTRDSSLRASLSEAIARGIAPDGGLYVPGEFPHFNTRQFDGFNEMPEIGERLLAPFFEGDALAGELGAICREAFNFPAPLVTLDQAPQPASVLELFHGPTCAFKDFGARFLAATMERIRRNEPKKLTILVATSGDTGGAVAAAFHGKPWVDVVVLYPKGLVSERQAQQLACWGGNVRTFSVNGTFDECQRMVKEAFLDPALKESHQLSSANSINVGRLLPQMVYYAKSSLELWRQLGRRPNYIIPTGNLGNAMACVWARHVGLPIGEIVLATNANQTITDFLRSGEWQPRASVATLASAMDVGNPSNMERLRSLHPEFDELQGQLGASSVDDIEIRGTLRRDSHELNRIWCPHTATAAKVYRRMLSRGARGHWVIVSTAHPAKFNDIVEPQTGQEVPVPPALAKLLSLPRQEQELEPSLSALRTQLQHT
ncbi:threonine synthase [Steroidobacter agaridevorans]|uniref:Threonine synthase n=1 Tax=Steroidobacter agaridevorans TaxID=2695856 RepID=A0A829YK12_9GAMM|nr:threonine synthase [Steroidobacter agaridevorans]GFE83529.1 threonine synthase [Steroidobacter agaridevorans]GFE86589.1 threonine synthase [Steroidobacter agaridevorans]